MKNLLTALFLACITAFSVQGQIKTPAASPSATFTQTVGLTDIVVEYSRPSAKDRTIFGADGLVPDGKVWRTGANSVTQISFSTDVMIEGQELKKGKYGILTTPSSTTWTVNFYSYEGSGWNSYVEKTPAVSATVTSAESTSHVESFTISLDDLSDAGATLNFSWAKTRVPVAITTNVDKMVMANIEQVMGGPTANDYYAAANYYFTAGKDLNMALKWINIATDGPDKRFWQIKRKSEILGGLGMKKEAIEAAQLSLKLATEAGNDDYIKMNQDNIKLWSM